MSGCPLSSYTPYMFICPCTFVHPLVVHTPPCPHTPLHLYVLRGFCMLWGFKVPPYMLEPPLHLPLYGGSSPSVYTPHSFVGFPVHQHVLGISVCYMGNISLCCRFGGCSPSVWGLGGHQHMGCPYAYSCTFL